MPPRIPTALFRPSTLLPSTSPSARRTLTTTQRMLLKENENRSPEEVEKKKQEQLDKQKRGEGHWHEELGSQSEGNVAADREDVKDHDDHISKLQHETKKQGEKGDI